MSFDPIRFEFTPPPTLQPPVVPLPILVATPLSGDSTSSAEKQLSNLAALEAASKYLQDAILSRFGSVGVELDLAARPDVGAALSRIYGTSEPPSIITISMLSNMLDAEASITQMEISLGPDSKYQPNPVQAADLGLVTGTVGSLLAQDGTFLNQLPNLLRPLKADQMVFQNWASYIRQYPVMRPNSGSLTPLTNLSAQLIPARGLDISSGLSTIMSGLASGYESNYASIYGFLAGISSVDNTIISVVNTYITTPIQDVVRVVGLLEGLKGLFHKNFLKNTADILTTFVFARLASEIGSLVFTLDRFVQMAVSPIKNSLSQVGRLLSTVNSQAAAVERSINQGAAAIGSLTKHGGVPGLPTSNACGSRPHAGNASSKSKPLIDPKGIPGLGPSGGVTQALAVLGQHLNWATSAADRESAKVQESLRKLVLRKLQMTADKLDTLCSLQSLGSLIGLAKGVVNETQRGRTLSGGSPQQQIETINRIVAQATSGAGTPYIVQNGQIVAVPPSLPVPDSQVSSVFQRGGLDTFSPLDISSSNPKTDL